MKRRPKSREDAENMISLPLKFDEVESVEAVSYTHLNGPKVAKFLVG